MGFPGNPSAKATNYDLFSSSAPVELQLARNIDSIERKSLDSLYIFLSLFLKKKTLYYEESNVECFFCDFFFVNWRLFISDNL